MRPDDLRAADTRARLVHAHEDPRGAECQQAVEKALKAFLAWHDQSLPENA